MFSLPSSELFKYFINYSFYFAAVLPLHSIFVRVVFHKTNYFQILSLIVFFEMTFVDLRRRPGV